MTTLVKARDEKKVHGPPKRGIALFVGHPKSGKTTTAAKFPGAYVLELEKNGGDRVDGKGLRIHDIRDTTNEEGVIVKSALDEFGDVLEAAIADDSVETVVIDTVDHLAKLMGEDILRRQGKDPNSIKMQDRGFEFWDQLRNRISALCDYIKDQDKLFILIAHAKAPERDETGRVVVPAGLNVSGKGGHYLGANAEFIAYVNKRVIGGKSVQYMSFNPPSSDMAIWGSRIDELDGKEILIPKDNPYAAFAAMFTEKSTPAPTTLVKKKK